MRREPVAETSSGRVQGARREAATVFFGIPYADAPRWGPPGWPTPWPDIRPALSPGPACPQPDRPVARYTHGEPPAQAEQCLNLNVFTPSLQGARPVMVWLHGGGFATGHAAATLYDGAALAGLTDTVVVSVNYRLGSLGWLCHPALAAEPGAPAGNWGLLDQIAALRWVRENIAAFGGDPGRVTVAGQSAGALSALDLLATADAAGLFSRLILQSPPLADVAQPHEAGVRWAAALSRSLGGADELDQARLRAAHPDELLAAQEELLSRPPFLGARPTLPTLEPATLPRSPCELPGERPEVDILLGFNRDEGTFFFGAPWRPSPPPDRVPAIVAHLCPDRDPDEVLESHRRAARAAGAPAHPAALLVAIATEQMVAEPVRRYARERAAAVAPAGEVFLYRFDHPGAGPDLRATHTAEVPVLFRSWADGGPGERLGGRGPAPAPVADALGRSWARFLHGHDPGWAARTGGRDSAAVSGVFGGEAAFTVQAAETTDTISI